MKAAARLIRAVPIVLASALLCLASAFALALADLVAVLRRRKPLPASVPPDRTAASVVIPNWNGRDLLARYLPALIEAVGSNPRNEIIVVDNGSEDGSADFVRREFPAVRVLALPTNLGFGGGSNAGFRAARNEIVVLLNSDMRVAKDFLNPLLSPFADQRVFAVSCQIFFSDPAKPREETGLTQGWWQNGRLGVRHRADEEVREAFPCFYGGGGSSAFDKRKFLELGGFDELLAPFYLEDTDLGFLAWKRGWKVLYEPGSRVWHEHRGTIGKRFSEKQIGGVLRKNYLLWTWKNIHDWRKLAAHFAFTLTSVSLAAVLGDAPLRPNAAGLWRAFRQLPGALRSRLRARALAAVSDDEAFRRPLGGYFRDRFERLPARPADLRVLFVSPYGMYPPVHGGGVFMYQTVRELARLTELHLIVMLDWPHEYEPHQPIRGEVASVTFLVRTDYRNPAKGAIEPHAVSEFRNPDLEWLIHRQIFTRGIDVLQLEYTPLAQYAAGFRQIPSVVFEHDVYFQSIARALPFARNGVVRMKAAFEYLRALRYESAHLRRADRIQVCSRENRGYLQSFFPALRDRIDDEFRAGIDTAHYAFRPSGREPETMLFLGSFRHLPNLEALDWFLRKVLPLILAKQPGARLKVVGAEPPPLYSLPPETLPHVDLLGFVDDVREPLGRYAVFVCPILSGSGVRVKLLEAFASGIPVVSTRLGAEGLASEDSAVCELADEPEQFAAKVVELLSSAERAQALAVRAREFVRREKDIRVLTGRLVDSYRELVARMRTGATAFPEQRAAAELEQGPREERETVPPQGRE